MMQISPELAQKRDRLLETLRGYGTCAVAFSGGLDSTVLAKAAELALGEQAVAVTGYSQSMAAGELEECAELARHIGIRLETVPTDELSIAAYRANGPDRCYHCKQEVFARVEEVAKRLGLAVVADGSNHDDQSDYRPGLRVLRERNVRSPLAECGLRKAELRELAAAWGLPVADKPATPCLSSRIAYGQEVTPERLRMIDAAERFLRERGFRPLRVRYHQGDMARIEVPAEQLGRFAEADFRCAVTEHFRSLGFKYIALDLEGFRSGSMNAVLTG
ncbi:MAG: ATP-dependent sacrificial sulfur transferase LarE [Planctomycetaceae bacterium]|nr:ATP-dependent sacrificial sulfur transferase LarE [Planctomycetaceae bacterium]